MTTIGFIGAGKIGSQVARKAIETGHDVVLSNSRGPETLAALVAELGPRARAATPSEAATAGDFVVVTIPYNAIESLPIGALAGKIVIDTNNYYFERDGHIAELDSGEQTVSGRLQALLPTSRVVKAFNSIYSAHITEHALPAGDPERRALVISSDDADAASAVTALLDEFGFDTVNVGPLSESWRVDRDQPAYGTRGTVAEVTERLAAATR